jgi:enamine deaminase RidA (YjgF/YER057c/UK114 family)
MSKNRRRGVVVSRLMRPGWLIEIEAVAAIEGEAVTRNGRAN